MYMIEYLLYKVAFSVLFLQAAPNIQIISHLPAVVVEEVQPDVVTDAARLAPEEIKVLTTH